MPTSLIVLLIVGMAIAAMVEAEHRGHDVPGARHLDRWLRG